jgi:hypothetical protein
MELVLVGCAADIADIPLKKSPCDEPSQIASL